MQLPRLAVKRPITTAMILISVLVIGGIAMTRLPLAYLPEVDVPFIGIEVPYPNSNPAQVEKEIVKPVEEVLATLPGVKTLNATAGADQAEFFLEFDWGHELDVVRMLSRIQIEQPEEVEAQERKRREAEAQRMNFQHADSSALSDPNGQPVPETEPEAEKVETFVRSEKKVGRNEPCPCGSGKKYKKCCGA